MCVQKNATSKIAEGLSFFKLEFHTVRFVSENVVGGYVDGI